jgi:dTDP-4-dehydrorhamnose reductase
MSQTGDCERNPALADDVNVHGTYHLAQAAMKLLKPRPHFIYLSTDLVFDGLSAPYNVAAKPAPVQQYGTSKLAAEAMFSRFGVYHGAGAVLRSALIFGAPTPHHQSFLQWMLSMLRGDAGGKLFADEIRTPVWVEDLCAAIILLMSSRAKGVYHCGGPDRLSRWQFGQLVAQIYGIPLKETLRGTREEAGLASTRPADVSLDSGKLHKRLRWKSTPTREALQRIRDSATS